MQNSGNRDYRSVVGGALFVAGSDASILLETANEPFDTVAQAVEFFVKWSGTGLVLAPRNSVPDAASAEITTQGRTAIAFITGNPLRTQTRTTHALSFHRALLQQWLDSHQLMTLARS